jgi:hypothetical protein
LVMRRLMVAAVSIAVRRRGPGVGRQQPRLGSLWRRVAWCGLMVGEQRADWMIGELVADDPAVTLRGDDLAGAQVPQRLGDRGVLQAGGDGQIGDADRPGGADANEQHEPGRIGQHGKVLRQRTHRSSVTESSDGLAGLFAVDDALVCAVGRNEVHEPQSAIAEDLIIQSGLTSGQRAR